MIQFLNDHQNTAAASTFKTTMFWAMETGTPATSLHLCSVTSVSIMPLTGKDAASLTGSQSLCGTLETF